MDRTEIQALIDRVIGKKGLLRAPSWWVRRLLNKMLDYCESLTPKIKVESSVNDSANPVQSKAVKEYVDDKVSKVGTEVVDNLESESTTAALSANQGRVLKERIGDIDSILDSINGEEV